jgi:hypothetical protein
MKRLAVLVSLTVYVIPFADKSRETGESEKQGQKER